MRKLLGIVVGVLTVATAGAPGPASAGPLDVLPYMDDRITWISTPTYTFETNPWNGVDYYLIDSRFKVRTLKPITDYSQVLISFSGPGQFISAGLAAPVFQTGLNEYHYSAGFPVGGWPPPGTYKVNSVCRYKADGSSRCRGAYPSEAVDLVIPPAS